MVFQYRSPTKVESPKIYDAVIQAINQFAFPLLPLSSIKRGWQNRTSLPPNTNEFALVAVLDRQRIGTNPREYAIPPDNDEYGTMTEMTLYESQVQVSFFSSSYLAEARAESFKSFVRGFLGASFFRQFGIGAGYCDDIRVMEEQDGGKQLLQHAMLYLHLQYWSGLTAELPFFDENIEAALRLKA